MEKPANFNANDPLEKQIKNLKNNGHTYTNDYLQQLLAIINNNNKVDLKIHRSDYNEKQKTRIKVLQVLLAPENAVEDERGEMTNFKTQFRTFLQKFNENGGYAGESIDIRNFKNYLALRNDAMKERLFAFVKDNSRQIGLKKNDVANFEKCIDRLLIFQEISGEKHQARDEKEGIYTYDRMRNFIKNSVRRLTREIPTMLINNVTNKNISIPAHWNIAKSHILDLKDIVNKHYKVLEKLYGAPIVASIMKKNIALTRDIELLAENTELNTYTIQQINIGNVDVHDIQLSKFLLKFYVYSILDNLTSIKDSDISAVKKSEDTEGMRLGKGAETGDEEEEEEEEYLTEEMIMGKQKKLEEQLAEVIVTFSNVMCNDKDAIDQNYTALMEKVQRAKDKEKDDITTAFKEMSNDVKAIQNVFKDNKLERWSKGLQKGLVVYNKQTYEEESVTNEKQALEDIRRSKKNASSSSGNPILEGYDDEDALADDMENERVDNEEMTIHYQGDAENEDYDDLDGDEYVP